MATTEMESRIMPSITIKNCSKANAGSRLVQIMNKAETRKMGIFGVMIYDSKNNLIASGLHREDGSSVSNICL